MEQSSEVLRRDIARTFAAPLHARDAIAQYYSCEYDPKRVKLTGTAQAWVAVCSTGMDLFRPFVVMGGEGPQLRAELRSALTPLRHYLFAAPARLHDDLAAVCHLHGENANAVYALTGGAHQPVVNILVQVSQLPDGNVRARIPARDGSLAAEAGTSWVSSRFAEVFVRVSEGARCRGLGKSVVSAVTARVLDAGRTPIYVTSIHNTAAQKLAERLGYADTGARELTGQLSLR
jgi:hypothetical protein